MAYSVNSGLVTYVLRSPNHSGLRTHKIDIITIHCVVGQLTAAGICACFTSKSRQASCNYAVGTDGSIGLCVDECNRSWCTSSNANDQRAVTIECASDTVEPYVVNDVAYRALIELCTDICKRNNIPSLKWKADKNLGVTFQVDQQNMTAHRWFAENNSCPGEYLYSRFGDIAEQVNKRLKDPGYVFKPGVPVIRSLTDGGVRPASKSSTYSGPTEYSSSPSISTILFTGQNGYYIEEGDYGEDSIYHVDIPIDMELIQDNLDYYIVTIDRFSKLPDIGRLMANRNRMIADNQKIVDARNNGGEGFDEHSMVSSFCEARKRDKESGALADYDTLGFIVEAGYYFDVHHNKMNSYFNPRIKEMVAALRSHDAPFGFFAVTRARNEQEARDEIGQLRYVFANYPTDLGFWLVMDLHNDVSTNNAILETYRHYLVDYYGFVQKMGLYATAAQLSSISWSSLQNDWFLWLVDHVSNLNEFLHPQTEVTLGEVEDDAGGVTTVVSTLDFLTPRFFMLDGQGHNNSISPPGMGNSSTATAGSSSDGDKYVDDGSGQGSGDVSQEYKDALQNLKDFLEGRFGTEYQGALQALRDFYGKDLENLTMEEAIDHLRRTGALSDLSTSEGKLQQHSSMQESLERLDEALQNLDKVQGHPNRQPPDPEAPPPEPNDHDNWGPKPETGVENPWVPDENNNWGPRPKPDTGVVPNPGEPGGNNWGPPGEGPNGQEEPPVPDKLRRRILLECAEFEDIIRNDRQINRLWRYKIDTAFESKSLADMVAEEQRFCNEYMFVSWMLQNINVISAGEFIKNDGTQVIYSSEDAQAKMNKLCTFIDMKHRLLDDIAKNQLLIPGDIILFDGSSNMQIYAGNHTWYDGGTSRLISGIYVWLSGRPNFFNKKVYGVLRLIEEEVIVDG